MSTSGIDYKLALELKNAGFHSIIFCDNKKCSCGGKDILETPSLSELIEACGESIVSLERGSKDVNSPNGWFAFDQDGWEGNTTSFDYDDVFGKTPEEAVARLWLALNKK